MKSAFLLLAIWLCTGACAAATAENKPDFGKLRSDRAQATADLDSQKQKLRELDDESRRIATSVKDITDFIERNKPMVDDARQRVDEARKAKAPAETMQRLARSLSDLESSLTRAQRDLEEKSRINKAVDDIRSSIQGNEKKVVEIETQITEMLDRDVVAQKFKSEISLYFAVVVALMIACFFGIAFYDSTVRNNIFSGQSGIQFVTLFLLIISIILFGITGILGDKELAALLGGLSGYILGKYNGESPQDRGVPAPTDRVQTPG
jgi:Skp family chaperone for outer membrane proteins